MPSSSRNERLVNEWWDLVLYEPEKLPDVSEPPKPKPRPQQVVWFRRTDQGQIRAWRVHRLHGPPVRSAAPRGGRAISMCARGEMLRDLARHPPGMMTLAVVKTKPIITF